MDAPRASKPRRLRTKLLLGVVLMLLLLFGVLALLPGLLGKGTLERLARGRLGSPVTAERASFSWLGVQRIEGLRIGTPEGFPKDDDPVQIATVTVKRGLLGLLRGKEGVEIEVDSPTIFVHRNVAGRFNFERVLRKDTPEPAGSPGGTPDGKPRDVKQLKQARSPLSSIPGLPLNLSAILRGGRVVYLDDLLGAKAEVESVEALLEGGPHHISLSLEADVGAGGSVKGDVVVQGLAGGTKGATVDGKATFASIDLLPYRGLFEKLLGVLAPETPVSGDLRLQLGTESLELRGSLDAGFLRIGEAAIGLPLEAKGAARGALKFGLDLAPALASLRGAVPALSTARLVGSLTGSVELGGVSSLADLGAWPPAWPARFQLLATLDGKDLDIVLPIKNRTHGLKEDNLRVSLRAVPAESDATSLLIELEGRSFNARIEGAARPIEAGCPFEVHAALDTKLLALIHLLGLTLPAGTEMAPEARARITDLRVEGRGHGESWSRTIHGSGRLELTGPVKGGGFTWTGMATTLVAEGGVFTARDLLATVNGGSAIAPEIVLDLREGDPMYHGRVKVEGAVASHELAPLLAYAAPFLALEDQQGALEGAITATLEISGRGLDTASLERSLAGEGVLRIREGKIHGSRFLAEASRLIGSDLGDVLFTEIGSDFTMAAGKVEVKKLFLLGREGGKLRNLGLAGHVWLDRRMDLGVDLGSLAETIGDRKILRVLKESRKILGDKVFPLRLRGTLLEPRLELQTSLESLPGLDKIIQEILKPGAGDSGKKEESDLEDLLDLFKKRKRQKK